MEVTGVEKSKTKKAQVKNHFGKRNKKRLKNFMANSLSISIASNYPSRKELPQLFRGSRDT